MHVICAFASLHLKDWFSQVRLNYRNDPKFLNFRTDRYGQTVQTQIRLLLEEEQSDPGLHCLLLFHLHLFDEIP